MTLPAPPLLLITDRSQARLPLPALVEQAFSGGCRWASLREKDLAPTDQVALAQSLAPIARRFGARLTLHGDPALAKAAGLDGVHLGAGGDVAAARALLGPEALVGISIHSVAEAQALDRTADYAVAGPFRETASKPGYGPALGAAGLAAMVTACALPVIAIGGIDAAAVPEVMASGSAGIAVMGGPMRAPEPAGTVRTLIAAVDAARLRRR